VTYTSSKTISSRYPYEENRKMINTENLMEKHDYI